MVCLFQSHFFPLTEKNLNQTVFTPTKDYNENRLKTGMLQLSDNTHIVLDETIMEAGQLDVTGDLNTLLLIVGMPQKVKFNLLYVA